MQQFGADGMMRAERQLERKPSGLTAAPPDMRDIRDNPWGGSIAHAVRQRMSLPGYDASSLQAAHSAQAHGLATPVGLQAPNGNRVLARNLSLPAIKSDSSGGQPVVNWVERQQRHQQHKQQQQIMMMHHQQQQQRQRALMYQQQLHQQQLQRQQQLQQQQQQQQQQQALGQNHNARGLPPSRQLLPMMPSFQQRCGDDAPPRAGSTAAMDARQPTFGGTPNAISSTPHSAGITDKHAARSCLKGTRDSTIKQTVRFNMKGSIERRPPPGSLAAPPPAPTFVPSGRVAQAKVESPHLELVLLKPDSKFLIKESKRIKEPDEDQFDMAAYVQPAGNIVTSVKEQLRFQKQLQQQEQQLLQRHRLMMMHQAQLHHFPEPRDQAAADQLPPPRPAQREDAAGPKDDPFAFSYM